ncbi:MAG: class I SAM-dependent methyltransferase [Acidobacteriaceae bacterium]
MRREAAATFRDPAGHVEFHETTVLRHVRAEYATATRAFLQAPFVERWLRDGRMAPTKVLAEGEELVLEHPRLFFASYPWEWCPAQWRAAAELTLGLCSEAIANRYILKDATPLNILFDGARPVFVDVLSFEKRDPESALWLAQAQFVRTFLLPLLAHRHLGWPLAASQLQRDGYEPRQLHAAMSKFQRVRPRLFWSVTLPTWLEPSAEAPIAKGTPQLRRQPALATEILQHDLAKLKKQVRHAAPVLPASRWSGYTTTAKHYSAADHAAKQEFVSRVLAEARPETVLDVGANTGTYSMLAAKAGARVVALDTDPSAVEMLWQRAYDEARDILPLVADIARPTPAVGWENAESFPLLERMEGKFDMVLLLAVLHHLLLMDQVPLERIAALVARITRKYALVEWVPQDDPMFQFLLRGRDEIYQHLQFDAMLAAFAPLFHVTARCDLANGRSLILFEKI